MQTKLVHKPKWHTAASERVHEGTNAHMQSVSTMFKHRSNPQPPNAVPHRWRQNGLSKVKRTLAGKAPRALLFTKLRQRSGVEKATQANRRALR